MNGKTDGLLLARALRIFSPEVFRHPAWKYFASSDSHLSAHELAALAERIHKVQATREYSTACDLWFVHAAELLRVADYRGALASIHQAMKLARHHRLAGGMIWGYWAAGAVYAQQGRFVQAGEELRVLADLLSDRGEWKLSDLVEMIEQALLQMETAPASQRKARKASPSNPMLWSGVNALLTWGKAPLVEFDGPPDVRPPAQAEVKRNSRSVWEKLLGWMKGEAYLGGFPQRSPNDPERVPTLSPAGWDNEGNQAILRPARVADVSAGSDEWNYPPQKFPQSGFIPASGSPADLPTARLARPSLAFYFLGAFRMYQDDQLVNDWPGQKCLSIFKFLVIHQGRPVEKDVLMDTFWKEADGEVARRNLHQAIYAIRQVLKKGQFADFPYIQFENDCYQINPALETWIDCLEFESRIRKAQQHESMANLNPAIQEYMIAEELYQGDFLEDDLYEDWPASLRAYYRTRYLDLLERLSAYSLTRGQHSAAITFSKKILARDNCSEQAYRCLMQCYLAQGQRQMAVREYHNCVQALKRELNLAPAEETQALYQMILSRR